MSLGATRYSLIMFKSFVNALTGIPTHPSIMAYVSKELGISYDGRICPICGRRFTSRKALKTHIVRTHGDIIDSLIREFYELRMKKNSYK